MRCADCPVIQARIRWRRCLPRVAYTCGLTDLPTRPGRECYAPVAAIKRAVAELTEELQKRGEDCTFGH